MRKNSSAAPLPGTGPAACAGLDFGRAIRTRITTARLCRGDLVFVFDPVSGVEYGTCPQGESTPYRRAL